MSLPAMFWPKLGENTSLRAFQAAKYGLYLPSKLELC